jgi:2-keto-4-pentenoate hydratase/2-oxohepta-3-ene-1,7-dioic acid hydratase in catechol pathway
MEAGDRVDVQIDGIGVLSNTCVRSGRAKEAS